MTEQAKLVEPVPTAPRIRVAGCPVDALSFEGAVQELCRRVDARIRTHVVFINVFKVAQFLNDDSLRNTMERADLLLADGMPIVWASRLIRTPLPERITGADLMERMLQVAAQRGYRVYFLGGQGDVVASAAEACRKRHPGLQIAGFSDGYFSDGEEDKVIADINASRADLLFVGISTPRKELWGDRNLNRLSVSICQGVGGTFDVVAGVTRRAPLWMQHCGLEWFFRLIQEPRRLWRRYLSSGSTFLWALLREVIRPTRTRDEVPATPASESESKAA